MFEKAQIASSINYLLRLRGGTHGVFRHAAVEVSLRPLLPAYANIMRQRRISADQAAVVLITDTVSKIEFVDLLMLQTNDRDTFLGLAQLYKACDIRRTNSPEKFAPHFCEPPAAVANWLSQATR